MPPKFTVNPEPFDPNDPRFDVDDQGMVRPKGTDRIVGQLFIERSELERFAKERGIQLRSQKKI